ncbi:hypothetical protein [Ruegeria marisrubri]|uniref:hypothetical protein n=1 Tax=Ruegeria marisrubri TaxID=1685379 RepID=UPI00082D635F|nr:hypothetical protein [Ruegeria marisrubri]
MYVPDSTESGIRAPNPGDFQGVVNAEMLLLDNPELSRQALETVGIQRAFPGLPDDEDSVWKAVVWLQDATTIELITGSYVVKVAVKHKDPIIAAELTNALTGAFLDRRRDLYAATERSTLLTRLGAAVSQAAEIENEISKLLGGVDPQFFVADLENASQDQANLERLMRQSRTNLAALEARQELYSKRLGVEDLMLATNIAIEEEEARIDYIERSMVENRKKVENLSSVMPKLRPLIELQQQQADRIANLKLRLRDSQAYAENEEGNVRVIEDAVPPLESSTASKKVQLAIVAIVSLLAGISVAGLVSILRSSEPGGTGSEGLDNQQKNGTVHTGRHPVFEHLQSQNRQFGVNLQNRTR